MKIFAQLIYRFQAWRRWRAMWSKPFDKPELSGGDTETH
jgi:hypothetical protein